MPPQRRVCLVAARRLLNLVIDWEIFEWCLATPVAMLRNPWSRGLTLKGTIVCRVVGNEKFHKQNEVR